jgi:hypothetical protein
MYARRLIGVVSLASLVLSCSLIPKFGAGPGGASDQTVQGAILNEVLFLPAAGEPTFVELKGQRARVSLAGLTLANERGQTYAFPDGLPQLGPDSFLLILFDGQASVEDRTVRAGPEDFLDSESGFLELRDAGGALLDRVAWGAGQPATVNLSRGGFVDELEPGTSIGRFPASLSRASTEWTIFHPEQTTPGAANPQPGVEVMLPLSGAILGQTTIELSWYPTPGSTSYQVQVSSDEAFTIPVVDETVNTPEHTVALQAGIYYWRVRAMAEDGAQADLSPVQMLTIEPGLSRLGHEATPARQAALAVPMLMQHKDTGMLLLESKRETGAHAWDVAHPGLDRSDPADAMNCVLASVAMINNSMGGDLSQDRIGYEIHKDFWAGPEYDLNYGSGLYAFQTAQALAFALGAEASYHPTGESAEALWEEITYEIDQGRPILATIPGHAFVVTGYRESGAHKIIAINDPWWGSYEADVDVVNWAKHFLISPDSMPVLQEPEISMHSDGDGIVDFDETARFGTSPNAEDTEKDDLPDKKDIRGSIFDPHFGYAVTGSLLGRDFDEDGMAMEVDPDSDGGGCFDGLEDHDFDGEFKEPETWNFDDGDDACVWGTDELVLDENRIFEAGDNHHQRIRTYVTFSAHAVEEGKLEGLAQIEYTWTGEFNNEICSGTHSVNPGYYGAKLAGEFQKIPGSEGTFFSIQATPDHGEPFTVQWQTACPAPPTAMDGWSWPGQGGTLVDGVYDHYSDYSASITNGEFWNKVHVEQGGAFP